VRFVLDQDVDARVAAALRAQDHDAWTVGSAGLALAGDDALTVYACKHGAALLTHDIEFSARRRKNVVGQHVSCAATSGTALPSSNNISTRFCRSSNESMTCGSSCPWAPHRSTRTTGSSVAGLSILVVFLGRLTESCNCRAGH
jgi:predicted nuclease of predicted toxin-antitoxin system